MRPVYWLRTPRTMMRIVTFYRDITYLRTYVQILLSGQKGQLYNVKSKITNH